MVKRLVPGSEIEQIALDRAGVVGQPAAYHRHRKQRQGAGFVWVWHAADHVNRAVAMPYPARFHRGSCAQLRSSGSAIFHTARVWRGTLYRQSSHPSGVSQVPKLVTTLGGDLYGVGIPSVGS